MTRLVRILLAISILSFGCDSDTEIQEDTSAADTESDLSTDTGEARDSRVIDTVAVVVDTGPEDTAPPPPCEPLLPPNPPTEIDYGSQIAPIIADKRCANGTCHDDTNPAADFDITIMGTSFIPTARHGPVYVRCDPANSVLIQKLATDCALPFGSRMPVSASALNEDELALFYQWVAEGGDPTYDPTTCP